MQVSSENVAHSQTTGANGAQTLFYPQIKMYLYPLLYLIANIWRKPNMYKDKKKW